MRFPPPYVLLAIACFVLGISIGVAIGLPLGAHVQDGSEWKPSDYADFSSIGGAWFGAAATAIVSGLALYFQHMAMEENKPKLSFEFKAAFIYEDEFFAFSIRSNGKVRVVIHSICFGYSDGSKLFLLPDSPSKAFGSILHDSAETVEFYFEKHRLSKELTNFGTSGPVSIVVSSSLGVDKYTLSKSDKDTLASLIINRI